MRKYSSWSIPDHFRLMEEFWKPKLLLGENPNYNEIFKEKLILGNFLEKKMEAFLNTISSDYYDIKDNEKYKNFLHDMIISTTGIEKNNIIHLDHHSCHGLCILGQSNKRPRHIDNDRRCFWRWV